MVSKEELAPFAEAFDRTVPILREMLYTGRATVPKESITQAIDDLSNIARLASDLRDHLETLKEDDEAFSLYVSSAPGPVDDLAKHIAEYKAGAALAARLGTLH